MNAPINTAASLASLGDIPSGQPDLASRGQLTAQWIGQLMAQERELTAAETFAAWHDAPYAQPDTYQALLPATPPAPGQQYAFEVNLDTCSGCKACVVACHTLNGLGETETWRKVGILTGKSTTLPVLQHVTTACHHCIDPGCLKGCPVLAYEKDPITGIVRHLDDQCFGCTYCTMMCPYEVPQYHESLGIVRKCDMCSQRLEQGEAPACVQACPNQAIKISLVDSAAIERSVRSTDACLVPTAPASRLTLPTTQFVSRTLNEAASAIGRLASHESNEDVVHPGHAPLVGMLVLTQASVGAWWVLATSWVLGWVPARGLQGPTWLATALGLIGVQLALLHLGRPWLAFRSFLGWRTSWLSREAIAFGAYLACASAASITICFGVQWFSVASAFTALVGAVAVVCSAMIYVATGRELWSLGRTVGEFFATAAGLGVAIASLAFRPETRPQLLITAGLLCGAAFIPKWLDWRRGEKAQPLSRDYSTRSGRLLHEPLAYRWRIACCSLAIAMSISMLTMLASRGVDWSSASVATTASFSFAWLASVSLMIGAQSMLRWLGFASVVYPRMPGAST